MNPISIVRRWVTDPDFAVTAAGAVMVCAFLGSLLYALGHVR